ncbi:nucleolar protein 12-like [Homarus americanus]|uniref:nucleolar protein 12-like n=1 Tax=Homarus americanus TaxID=6706 RepID=UPI001C455ACD|nr:nucleolar protein 12-like [Homarus americanus]
MKTDQKNKPFKHNKKWKPKHHKNNQLRPTNRQNKLHIKFDPDDRREYLTGFQKRKRERREKAHKKIEDDLKMEMKKIRKDRVQLVKKMVYQNEEVPESDNDKEEESEDENVTVTNCGNATVEISGIDLISSQYHIGTNQMDIGSTNIESARKKRTTLEEGSGDEEEEINQEKLTELGIHCKKDLYRSLKKSTFQIMKKSKLMKMKQARDAKKQKKAQARVNNHKRKLRNKKMKRRQTPFKEQEA